MSPKVAQAKLNHSNITTTLLWYHNTNDDDLVKATGVVSVKGRGVQDAPDEAAELARLFGLGRGVTKHDT
jgi:hypothetical protein